MDTSNKKSDSSNEESNDVVVSQQLLSVGKRSLEEDRVYPVKRHRSEELELDEPSTSGIASNFYNSESSAPKKTLHGLTYQLRLLMLFVQRVPDGQEFFLATEMHEAGLFDDIVLKYLQDGIWRYRFLQAKHKNDDTYKIKKIDIFNKKSKSKKKSQSSKNVGETKPYLLKKYFESYCAIRENSFFNNAKLEEFLICTNVGFDDEALTYFKCTEENDDDPILGNRVDFEEADDNETNPVKFKLSKKKIPELKEDFGVNSQNKNYFSNFVKKFRFLTNYEDNELNENIQNCLKKYLKIENVDLAKAYLQSRVLKWFESYRDNKSKYLLIKDKEEFLKSLNKNIESLLVAGYSNFYIEELKSYGVQFENILPFREFFTQKKGKIMFITTASPKLSIIKLNLLFSELELSQDEVIFTNGDQLNYNKKIFTIFFAEPSYKWLVIECHSEIKLERNMLANILKIDNKKTVVIIAREDNVLKLKKCFRLNAPCFDDNTNLFKDLTSVSQEKILERQVIFQGKEVNLNELIDIYSGRKIIDGTTLEKLLTEKLEIGSNNAFISEFLVDNYYIPRRLIERELRLSILQNEELLKTCLFFISGVNKDQLKNLNINNEWISLWKESKIFKNGIVLSNKLISEDIFKELCKDDTKNIVWLEHLRGKFLIRNIRNETDILHKHIICLEEHDLDKKQILERKIIILADGPGCGKSIFMTKVARQLKQIMSNIWILRINLSHYAYKQKGQNQFVKCLEDIEFIDDETNKAIEFMADLLFPQECNKQNEYFVRKLFTQSLYCLNENIKLPKIILLFDGFDEISPRFKEKTLTLLKALRNSNVAQMWIATRNQEEVGLEEALHSSAFFLNLLNLTEKINFLKTLWKYFLINFDSIKPKSYKGGVFTYFTEIKNNIGDKHYVYNYNSFVDFQNYSPTTSNYTKLQLLLSEFDFLGIAEDLIHYLEYFNLHKISDFTDNPLQLKMMAEIMFIDKFKSLENMAIVSLYDDFIKYKWTFFCEDKNAAGNSLIGHELFEDQLEYLTSIHQEIAFQSLFPQHDNKPFKEVSNKIALSRAGLLVMHDDRLEFVHRSFAEYFVSQYFAENFQCENIQKIVFSDVLIKENYSLIRAFLNNNTVFLHKLSCKTQQMIEIIKVNSCYSQILYEMFGEALYNLFMKFLENLPLDFAKNAILFNENDDGETVLHGICGPITDGQLFENMLKTIKDSIAPEIFKKLLFKTNNEGETALHSIIPDIDSSIVKQKLMFFKLNCDSKLFYELLLQVDEKGKTILHIACEGGKDITYLLEVTHENSTKIQKLLSKTDNNGLTALHYAISRSDNPSLVTTLLNLVNLVWDPNIINEHLLAIDNDSPKLLHTACSQTNEDILFNFLNAIKDNPEMLNKLLLEPDEDGLSALHCIGLNCDGHYMLKTLLDFVKLNCSTEMLRTLLCKENQHGGTILHVAFKRFKEINRLGLFIPLLTYLFNLVENSKEVFDELLLTRDENGQTVLHYSSYELDIPSILKDLLEFIKKNCSVKVMSELLLKLDTNNLNMLHYVCFQNCELNLTSLLNTVQDNPEILDDLLFQTDSEGQTALHYTVLNFESFSMTETLLNFVKMNCDKDTLKKMLCKANNDSSNILHIACSSIEDKKEYEQTLISLLNFIKYDETICNELLLKTCCCGCTPLHYTVCNFDNPSMIKILLNYIKSYNSEILDTLLLKQDNKGKSLLHLACEQTKYEILKYLLDAIQDNNAVRDVLILKADHNGQTILHYSVRNFKILKFVLDFVKLNCSEETFTTLILKCDNDERTGLHIFCQTGDSEEVLVYLLDLIKDNITPEVFNQFLTKKDCHGKVASDYIACNASSSSLSNVLLNYSNVHSD